MSISSSIPYHSYPSIIAAIKMVQYSNNSSLSNETPSNSSGASTTRPPILSPNPNDRNPNGYIIKKGKMVGIKMKKCENILLLCNKYEKSSPTVNFEYLNACQQQKRIESVPIHSFLSLNDHDSNTKVPKLRYRVSSTVWEYNSVKNALLNAGLQRTKTNNWNVLWSKHLSIDQLKQLHPAQKTNHFPGSSILGRKDKLNELMRKCQSRHGLQVTYICYFFYSFRSFIWCLCYRIITSFQNPSECPMIMTRSNRYVH